MRATIRLPKKERESEILEKVESCGDELVMVRVKDKGDLYVHQDANWNVIALTDLGGKLAERYVYTPYGQVSVFQESGFGDREGDQDVDSLDKGTPGTTCSGGAFVGACRVLDLDFDGDYDNADGTLFDSLESGVMVRLRTGSLASARGRVSIASTDIAATPLG